MISSKRNAATDSIIWVVRDGKLNESRANDRTNVKQPSKQCQSVCMCMCYTVCICVCIFTKKKKQYFYRARICYCSDFRMDQTPSLESLSLGFTLSANWINKCEIISVFACIWYAQMKVNGFSVCMCIEIVWLGLFQQLWPECLFESERINI